MRFLRFLFLAVLCFAIPSAVIAQGSDSQRADAVRQAYDAKQWEEAVRFAKGPASQPADFDYWEGMALAHLGRWAEARQAFSNGHAKAPGDTRFLTERAGAEYRLKDFKAAKHDLRQALRLSPGDTYPREFLGTIYLLESNVEAALKYWKPLDKPRLAAVQFVPPPDLDKRLAERGVAFHAPAILERGEFLETDARLTNLDVFSAWHLELRPADHDNYEALLRTSERPSWGRSWLGTGLSLIGGLPYQTLYPSVSNVSGEAVNIDSIVRWDPEKRRFAADVSFPLFRNPSRRLRFFFDARNENWNLSRTFSGSASPITDLNMRRFSAGAEVRIIQSGRWNWTTGVEIVSRSFRNVPSLTAAAAQPFFTDGISFAAWLRMDRSLIRVPERRFTLDGSGEVRFGRGFASSLGPFATVRGGLDAHWLPQATGDDYEVSVRASGADTIGDVPLDQLFELGLDRDNDLWLRGHRATIDGRKGGAPLGRRYLLANAEFSKIVYNNPIFRIQLGPFLDSGAVADPTGLFGSDGWQWDAGAQMRVRVFGGLNVKLSYGWDLRKRSGTFYGAAVP